MTTDQSEPHLPFIDFTPKAFAFKTLPDAPPDPVRKAMLEEAVKLTCGERNRTYGDPYGQHRDAARIFNAQNPQTPLLPSEIVGVLLAVKRSRLLRTRDHRDSRVDSMAYEGIEHECVLMEQQDPEWADLLRTRGYAPRSGAPK